jgi:Zn-dependent protease with chaperone function
MGYQAIALDRELFEKGRQSGSLEIAPGEVVFRTDETEFAFPIDRLEIERGGAQNRLIYFKHPDFPETSFFSSDASVLKDPLLCQHALLGPMIDKLQKRKWKGRLITGSILAVIFVAILIPVLFFDSLVRVAADQVPFEWEQKIGEALFESITADSQLLDDELLLQQLSHITQPVVDVIKAELPQYEFDFYISNDPTLNAFALPGGKVIFHSGLLLAADSPEEIAGVLAHELAHVTCRHHIRSLLKQAGVVVVVGYLAGDVSSLSNLIITSGGSLALLKNSRTHELEADEQGWNYLVRANIPPDGMIAFFRKLEEQEGAGSDLVDGLDFLSTHPAVGDRIEILEGKKDGLSRPDRYYDFGLALEDFKEQLQAAIDTLPKQNGVKDESGH